MKHEIPHGCVGRIGAEYSFFDEKWILYRVDEATASGAPLTYVFRSVKRASAYILLTLRRFLKLTKYWDGRRLPWRPYRIPCFQCRVPIPALDGSLFCDTCRPTAIGVRS